MLFALFAHVPEGRFLFAMLLHGLKSPCLEYLVRCFECSLLSSCSGHVSWPSPLRRLSDPLKHPSNSMGVWVLLG